jgi:hypothetical protein
MVSEMIGEFWNASGDSETTLLSSPASIFAPHSRSSRKNGERDVQVLAVVRRHDTPMAPAFLMLAGPRRARSVEQTR